MGKKKQQLMATILMFGIVLGFSGNIFGELPTNPEKVISKSSITFIGEKPTEIVLDKIPRKAESFQKGELVYRYYEGYFYKQVGEQYVRTQAPVGVVVKEIPNNYQRIIINGQIFYYSNGTFFVAKGKKEFITSLGPIGGQVSELPDGYQNIKIDGRSYFLYYDLVLKKGQSRSRNYYEVFGYVGE